MSVQRYVGTTYTSDISRDPVSPGLNSEFLGFTPSPFLLEFRPLSVNWGGRALPYKEGTLMRRLFPPSVVPSPPSCSVVLALRGHSLLLSAAGLLSEDASIFR